jgi:DNA (cytosine-5)-methyltransferase 1
MLDTHNLTQKSFTIELLADILSLPKRSIESKIHKGELQVCPESGLISEDQVLHYPQIKNLLQSRWADELKVQPKRPYNLVELFAGGGGLALGLESVGFKTILVNELDRHACGTLRYNRPDWNIVEGDVSNVDFSSIDEEIDILTGGFPCQAFSYAGNGRGFEDIRGTLFFEMARAIKEMQPKVFMAENVRALLTHDNGKTLETIKNVIDELGYVLVEPKILKAIFYKVPQKRERLILIGIRKDLSKKAMFKWPSPYHRVMTLKDAFQKGDLFSCDVPKSQGQVYPQRKKEIMSLVPQGGYWRDLSIGIQKEYMKKSFYLTGGKTGMARRLSMSEPSLTLTCAPAQKQTERCHPIETRPLQIREYARIQTFPDDWSFQGPLSAVYKQIGNAVPVNMAAAIGRSLVRLLNELNQ